MNKKNEPSAVVVITILVIVWLTLRTTVYSLFAPLALSLDILLSWFALPNILHIFSVILLTIGLEASNTGQKISYTVGLFIESTAVLIDKINSVLPPNALTAGAPGRKVMVAAFLSGLEKRAKAKKYITAMVKDFRAHSDTVPLANLSSGLTFLAEIAHQEGNYKEARKYAEETLALIESDQADPVLKAAAMIDMCSTYIKQGLIEESIETGIKAVSTLDSADPHHNQLQAIAYNNLSLAYSYAADYEQALKCARRSVNLKVAASGGKETNSVAIARSNISDYLIYLGRYDDALDEAKKALLCLDTLGFRDGLLRATVLQNLGSSQLSLGDVESAKTNLLTALAGKTKHMPTKDPEWSSVYLDLGLLYGALKEQGTADGYFDKSIAIARKDLGEKHPRLAFIYSRYAAYLESTGRDKEASAIKKEASEIMEHWVALKKERKNLI